MRFRASWLNLVIKILASLGSLGCYFLLLGFWDSFETRYHRVMVTSLLPGYAVVYLAFTLGVLFGENVDRSLNRVCAMFGVGAYVGAASACWLHISLENRKIGGVYCYTVVAGSIFQAVILTVDFILVLKNPPPIVASLKIDSPKIERLKTDSPRRSMGSPDSSFQAHGVNMV